MTERITLPVNPEEHIVYVQAFKAWYRKAKPYDSFIYYYGYHLHESLASSNIKHLTWDFACDGKIYLVARKDPFSKGKWEYICQKAKEPNPKLIPARTAKERN